MRGGNRENAGRPIGSSTQIKRALIRDVVSEAEQKAILRKAVNQALAGDKDLLKFFLEHLYGKPPQPIEVSANLRLDQMVTASDVDKAIEAERQLESGN